MKPKLIPPSIMKLSLPRPASEGDKPFKADNILFRRLCPQGLLSFGPDFPGIELRAMNLIIGPNGSGKSNLIEAISLLRASPRDWSEVTRKGGGVGEWIWKGATEAPAALEAILSNRNGQQPLRHSMKFRALSQTFALDDERIEPEVVNFKVDQMVPLYGFENGNPVLKRWDLKTKRELRTKLSDDRFSSGKSILAQVRDPIAYPELAWLTTAYESIGIYRDWTFGRGTVFRQPQKADMPANVLAEDFSNLGQFLNRLKTRFPGPKKAILGGLNDLYDEIDDFNVLVEGNTLQLFFTEGDLSIPAIRLSDGTLRYLCLLAILCDPEPPKLVCIEEPEIGLHPDILPKVADLLLKASERTQLIVTTHSDILVDAMTETPENVVVCEKHEGKTEMKRLESENLKKWLEKYRLGQLWTKGEIGGTRW